MSEITSLTGDLINLLKFKFAKGALNVGSDEIPFRMKSKFYNIISLHSVRLKLPPKITQKV